MGPVVLVPLFPDSSPFKGVQISLNVVLLSKFGKVALGITAGIGKRSSSGSGSEGKLVPLFPLW